MQHNVNLNPNTVNEDVGAIVTDSHLIPQADFDIDFGFYATVIKSTLAGTVVWYNKHTDTTGVWSFEAGEAWPIGCTKILLGATIDGQAYTTSMARTAIWIAANSNQLRKPNNG